MGIIKEAPEGRIAGRILIVHEQRVSTHICVDTLFFIYILKGNLDLMFFVLNACTCAVVH